MSYKANFDIPSAITKKYSEVPPQDISVAVTVESLCKKAGIRYRVTGGRNALIVIDDETDHHVRSIIDGALVYIVGGLLMPISDPERSARILEVVAHAFHDYAARECLCFKGIFKA